MANHTKHPWHVVKPMHPLHDTFTHAICGPTGESVAWVAPPYGEDGPKLVGGNAALIAAAPDLLAACELWDQGFTEGDDFTPEQFLAWVNKNRRAARAAIQKAKGAQ